MCSNESPAEEGNVQFSAHDHELFHIGEQEIITERRSFCSLLALLQHELLFNLLYCSTSCSLKGESLADLEALDRHKNTHLLYYCYTIEYSR